MPLPFDSTAPRLLREAIRSRFGDEPWVGDACLVASELSTNALTHGSPPMVAAFAKDNGARAFIAVADGAPPEADDVTATPTLPSTQSVSGRGLAIVAYLTHRLTVSPFVHGDGTNGKIIEAELEARAEPRER